MEPSPNPNRADGINPTEAPNPVPPASGPDGPLGPPLAPPLTPMGWLKQNGVILVLMAAGAVWIVRNFGLAGLFNAFLAALGVGLVIFVHELGHFLAAKWCDVHVITFSIGFGPSLPGCSFQRGETTYKIGVLPLGGFVNMVGEGPEADEDESYPRSFKNKSVYQRMLIISAGVIMNVIFGFLCFVLVFNHGVERPIAKVWRVDAGSPAWKQGVPVGSTVKLVGGRIVDGKIVGGIANPTFDELRSTVALSGHEEQVPFLFQTPDGQVLVKTLTPRRDANDTVPVIGIGPAQRLQLIPKRSGRRGEPVLDNSPASAARLVPLKEGDVVLATTDPANPGHLTPVSREEKRDPFGIVELSRRMRRLRGEPFKIQIERDKKTEELEVPVGGFEWEDNIIGSTVSGVSIFAVKPLPDDPSNQEMKTADPLEFRRRMQALAGEPVFVEVRRKDGATVRLLVPAAFHVDFGIRMKMGGVAALRVGSPAEKAGVKPPETAEDSGDLITKVTMTFEKPGPDGRLSKEWKDLDPMRLPYQLASAARQVAGRKQVTLTVLRPSQHEEKETNLGPMDWDTAFDGNDEPPSSPAAPVAIPQLGVAYYVTTTIAEVLPNSPAARAVLEVDDPARLAEDAKETDGGIMHAAGLVREPLRSLDTIQQIRFRILRKGIPDGWTGWQDLKSIRGSKKDVYDEWPFFFNQFQDGLESHIVQVRVLRDNKLLEGAIGMTANPDYSWPLEERGWILSYDTRMQRGENLWQSMGLGLRETQQWIVKLYQQLRSLVTARISSKALGGPIEIASQAFFIVGEDYYSFIMFLGLLSVNLAVLNFLPIPLMDGGHMVFLIYEWLRGRPPSEMVRTIAAYIGLSFIGALLLFVLYQDVSRRFFGIR